MNSIPKQSHKDLIVLSVLLALSLAVAYPLAEWQHSDTNHSECEYCVCFNQLTDLLAIQGQTLSRFKLLPVLESTHKASNEIPSKSHPVDIRGPPELHQ